MHGLVQIATRKWLETNGQLEKWKQQYIKNLYVEFPTGEFQNWKKCQAFSRTRNLQQRSGQRSKSR